PVVPALAGADRAGGSEPETLGACARVRAAGAADLSAPVRQPPGGPDRVYPGGAAGVALAGGAGLADESTCERAGPGGAGGRGRSWLRPSPARAGLAPSGPGQPDGPGRAC